MNLRDEDNGNNGDKFFAIFITISIVIIGVLAALSLLLVLWALVTAGIIFLTKFLVVVAVVGGLSFKVYPHIKKSMDRW